MEKITEDSFVTLEGLVELLQTSESTVRRDLDELESERKLHRVHGGAELHHSLREELTNKQKSIKNVHHKSLVANKASTLINDGDVIFIDAGTTTELLVDLLYQENLTVVTDSIHHAAKLVDKNFKTIIIGGFVKNSTDASIGRVAVEQISQLNFDKAFIGMNGVDEEFLTTPDIEEAAIKRTIIENAQKSYVLLDATKLGQVSFVKVARIEDVSLITTKSEGALLEKIKEKTEVIEV
ncbi:MAG: DeoR/GlpR family DNA-binding transcription regulator [Streptococcus orisratti]|nr:DeoR/GlpR family DNA-binding transcription regulator [Streptococcus orisratti]